MFLIQSPRRVFFVVFFIRLRKKAFSLCQLPFSEETPWRISAVESIGTIPPGLDEPKGGVISNVLGRAKWDPLFLCEDSLERFVPFQVERCV